MSRRAKTGFRRAIWFAARALASQRSLIFRPTREERGTPADLGMPFETLSLQAESFGSVRAWWVSRDNPQAAVILFPGRGVNISYELDAIYYLWQLDASVLAVDYPGFGTSQGQPSEQACYATASAAWQELTEHRSVMPENVILYGRSLGAAVAAWLAARVNCRGLVFHGGFPSLPRAAQSHLPAWSVNLFCRTTLDAERWIAQCTCPLLVLHAKDDRLVPLTLAKSVFDRAKGPKRFVEIPGDHYGMEWIVHPGVLAEWKELLKEDHD